MADFQQQKSLVLSFYSELEKATSETIDQVLAENLVSDFHWYGVTFIGTGCFSLTLACALSAETQA